MLHAVAAQASGANPFRADRVRANRGIRTNCSPTSIPDAASLPVEPPPMMIRPTFGNSLQCRKPAILRRARRCPARAKVRIRSETHYATLYYTTNGWTPTTQSAKYTGPITINSNTHLEVIAVGPNFVRSVLSALTTRLPTLQRLLLSPRWSLPRTGRCEPALRCELLLPERKSTPNRPP